MNPDPSSRILNTDKPEDLLLQLIQKLMKELHPETCGPQTISLDSSLDRDLGLDSLARVELLARLEQTFDIRLPEQVLVSAETPRDLLRLLGRSEQVPVAPQPPTPSFRPPADRTDVDLAPHQAHTLTEVLISHVQSHPDRGHIILEQGDDQSEEISYRDLYQRARELAAGLQQRNLQPGDSVAIMLPTSADYFFTFFAVLLAGGIPVPLYPPLRPSQIEEHLRRHQGILSNAQARIMITVEEVRPIARLLKAQVPTLAKVSTPAELLGHGDEFVPMPAQPGDIAFLQYTSGSTGAPKGVILSHANLLANIRAMGQVTRVSASDVFVSWLPLYHDMGLIGAWLGSLYYGCRLVIMPPLSFLARPERWLWAIHRHRATLSAAPNFGYELCWRRINEQAIEGLDLSSWRLAFNGAEPVSPATIRNFEQRFAPYGFRPEAASPVYGLAESSVGLAFPPLGRGPIIDRIRRDTLQRSARAVPAGDKDSSPLTFVACGQPLPGHQIRIVDLDHQERELPERHEGRLQFKGPSACSGYFRNPEQTRALFHQEWLDSGDLAYIAGGDVFITSRIKDIIIRGGRNIYPQELEEAIGNIEGIRKGCIAVLGSPDPDSGTERLIIIAESRKKETGAKEALQKEISSVAVDLLGLPPDHIVIAPPGTVLKTSSGKIRRAACRELYEQGAIGKPGRPVWLQLLRISLSGLLPQLHRLLHQTNETLYAAYCWFLSGLIGMPLWLLVSVLPWGRSRWRLVRQGLTLLTLLSGSRITVRGREHIPRQGPCILVSNHMSYLDGLILMAALPIPCSFTAKAELADNFWTRTLLSRLDVVFVDRFDPEQGLADTRRIAGLAASGKVLLFFAEGTLQRMPGLLPFQMGAFVTAAQTGIPVIPITIRGSRNKLRSGSWFPRRGGVSLTCSAPLLPDGQDWQDALSLRDAVRAQILHHSGEPDLASVYTSLSQMEIKRPERQEKS